MWLQIWSLPNSKCQERPLLKNILVSNIEVNSLQYIKICVQISYPKMCWFPSIHKYFSTNIPMQILFQTGPTTNTACVTYLVVVLFSDFTLSRYFTGYLAFIIWIYPCRGVTRSVWHSVHVQPNHLMSWKSSRTSHFDFLFPENESPQIHFRKIPEYMWVKHALLLY